MLPLSWNPLAQEDPLVAIDQVSGEAAQFTRMRELWDANCEHNALIASDFFCGGFAEQFERNGERIAGFLRHKLGLDATARLLDLGGGIGRLGRYLLPEMAGYALADVSPRMLDRARARLGSGAHLTLLAGNALPFASESFTSVVAVDLAPFLPQPTLRAYFAEVARLLVPGGHFLLTTGVAHEGPEPDAQTGRQLLRLLGLRPLPVGDRPGQVLADLTAHGPLRLVQRGEDFPNQFPLLALPVPYAGNYLLFKKPAG